MNVDVPVAYSSDLRKDRLILLPSGEMMRDVTTYSICLHHVPVST